jgi:uncharacterized Zn finger protein
MPRGRWTESQFPQAKTIRVDDGIKANSRRGSFAERWWAKRWLQVLESLNLGSRLASGRTYARKGQVTSIEFHAGRIDARVQGSQRTPYKVHIALRPFTSDDRERLAMVLAGSPLIAAGLAAGTMPEQIESALETRKLALFPMRRTDLETECDCPDWSNPCKHIAAVYYLVGEEFDRDPFLIFTFRGISREELMAMATARAAQPVAESSSDVDEVSTTAPPAIEERLMAGEAVPRNFWDAPRPTVDLFAEADRPEPRALLMRLGPFPFWRGDVPIAEMLGEIYERAAMRQRERGMRGDDESESLP